ncbi:MAG TPA: hypothetical protein VGF67_28605 [Ktedonobacteraceae bacterium]|jgi:hypothetical protein
MAVISPQCPNCQRSVPADVQTCPHCGVYLHLPDYPGFASAAQANRGSARPALAPDALAAAIKQCDTLATTTMAISGMLIAFYAGALFAGRVLADSLVRAIVSTLPIPGLLLTIVLSVRVLTSAGSPGENEATRYQKKHTWLRYSLLALQIALGVLAIAVFLYLLRPASAP